MVGIESLSYQAFAASIGTHNRGQVAFDGDSQGLKLVHHHKFSSRSTEMTAENLAIRERFAEVVRQKLGDLATDGFMAQVRTQLGLGEGVEAAEPLDRATIHDILAQVNAKTSLLHARAEGQHDEANALILKLKEAMRRITLISTQHHDTAAYEVCNRASVEDLAFPSEDIQKQARAALTERLAEARKMGLKGLPSSLSEHQLDNLIKGNLPRFMDGVARHLLEIHNAGFNLCANHLVISSTRLLGTQGEEQAYNFSTVAVAMTLREMLATSPAGELAAAARNAQDLEASAVVYAANFRGAQIRTERGNPTDVLTREEVKRYMPTYCKQIAALAQTDLAAFGRPADKTLQQGAEAYFLAPSRDPAKHAQICDGLAKLNALVDGLHQLQELHDKAFAEGQDDAVVAAMADAAARVDALLGDEASVAAMRMAAKRVCPETILGLAFKQLATREQCSGHFFTDCAAALAKFHLQENENVQRTPSVTFGEVPVERMQVSHVSSEEAQMMLQRLPPREAQVLGLLLGDLPECSEMCDPRNPLAHDVVAVRDALRSFPLPGAANAPARGDVVMGAVFSRNVSIQGVTVAIAQQHDGILTASLGGVSVPLHLSAGNLADALERTICANASAPENFAQVQRFMEEALAAHPTGKLPAGLNEQLRALAAGTIASYAGVPVSQLDGVSTEALVETIRTWQAAAPGHTPEVMAQMFAAKQVEAHQIPVTNGLSILEMVEALHQTRAEEVEAKVGYRPVPVAPGFNTKHKLAFTPEQYQLKSLIADLFFEKDTWVADANTSPEQRAALLRQTLLKYVGLLAKAITSPLEFDRLLKSLPLPGGEEARQLINGRISMLTMALAALMAQFKGGATEKMVAETLTKLFRGEEVKLAPESQAALDAYEAKQAEAKKSAGWFSILTKVTDVLAGTGEEVPADVRQAQVQQSVNVALAGTLNDDFFNALDDNIRTAVNGMMEGMQEAMFAAVEAIFGPDEGDREALPELSGDRLAQIPDRPAEQPDPIDPEKDLDTMLGESLKGKRGQGAFIRKVLCHYFAEVNDNDKRAMLASALRDLRPMPPIPEGLSEEERQAINEERMGNFLSGLLKGAGPLLQKMLQGLPEEGVPEGLRDALRDMKSNLAPIPETIVKAQLLSMVERSNGQITRIEMVKSLGAASVGQALLCKLYTPDNPEGQLVVVKLLRPDVTGRMAREKELMQRAALAVGSGMLATYNGQLERVLEELDLNLEATNTERGKIYNGLVKGATSTNVSGMRLCPLVPPSTTALVAELAPGTTLDDFFEESRKVTREVAEHLDAQAVERPREDPDKGTYTDYSTRNTYAVRKNFAKQVSTLAHRHTAAMRHHMNLLDLASKWVEQGIFKSGFYHGDLHAGNIMVSNGSTQKPAHLTVIDFGNATSLTKEQQILISQMTVAAAAGAGYAKTFRHAFHSLLSPKYEALYQNVREDYLRDIEAIFSKGGPSQSGQRIAVALLRAQDYGLELPSAIFNFSQSQIRLQNAVNASNTGKKQMLEALNKMLNIGRGGNATLDPITHLMGTRNLANPDIKEAQRTTLIKAVRTRFDDFATGIFLSNDALRRRLSASKDPEVNRRAAIDFIETLQTKLDNNAINCLMALAPADGDLEVAVAGLLSPNGIVWASTIGPELTQHISTFGPSLGMDVTAAQAVIDRFTTAFEACRAASTPEHIAQFKEALASLQQTLAPIYTLDKLRERCTSARSTILSFYASKQFSAEEVQAGIDRIVAAYGEMRDFLGGHPLNTTTLTYINGALTAIFDAERQGSSAEVDNALQSYYDDVEHGGAELQRAVAALREALRAGMDPASPDFNELKMAFSRTYQNVIAEALFQVNGGLEALEQVNFTDKSTDFLNVMDDVVSEYTSSAIKTLGALKGFFMKNAIRRARAAEGTANDDE